MGTLSIPASGIVYLDTAPVIYTIERHADYEALLLPLWAALDNHQIEILTSELTLLETLVKNDSFVNSFNNAAISIYCAAISR